MATLRNLMIRLGIDFDETGSNRLSKGLDNVAKKIDRTSGALDKMRLPAAAVGLASMAGAATSAAVSLVPLAASAGAMPAIFAANKAAAGTLKVAMMGVGEAMSAVASGDAKALKESLKELSPEAQKFVKTSAGFVKSFEPIRKGVQDRLFANLSDQVKPLANNLLPTAQRGMNGVASSFNKGALEAAKFGQTPIAKGALNAVFKMTQSVLKEASTAVQPFLGAVAKLVVLGIPLAKQMASWAINGIKTGSAWVTSAEGAAKLSGWMQRAGVMLGQLGRIGRNVVTFVVNLFSQANTNSTDFLGTLERLTAKMSAWSQSAAGQEQAANTFKLLGDVFRQIASILPIIIGPLGAIAKLIGSLPPDVQGTVTTFLAFGVVAGALGGKLATVGGALLKTGSGVVQFAGGLVKGSAALGNNATFAAKAGGALRTFGGTLVSGIAASGRMVVSLSAQAGAWLLNTSRMVASKVAMIATTVASKAMAIGIRLVNAAMRANPIGLIVTLIAGLVAIIVVAYKKNETFRKIVDAVWKGIRTAIQFAWEKVIKPALQALWNFIVNTLAPKFLWFHNNIVMPVFRKIGQFISAAWNNVIKPVFSFLAKTITQTIPNAFKNGVAAIGRFWDKVKEIAKAPIRFVVNTVYNNGIARIWNWIADKTGLGRIPTIQGFAQGGVLPGFSRKDNQLIMARSGEGILVPEAVKALGSGFIHQANAAAKNGGPKNVAKVLGIAGDPGGLGIPGFQEGGIVGWVKGFFSKAKNFFLEGLVKAIKGVTDPLLALSRNTIAKNGFGSMIHAAVQRIVTNVIDKLKSYESEVGGGAGMKAVRAARSQIGVPYSWGGGGVGGASKGIGRGANTVGFDCSGLTEYAWWKATGKSIGGTTFEQIRRMKRISKPRPGAVGQPHINHTYLANEKGGIIEAPYTGARVREVGMRHTPTWLWPAYSFDNGGMWNPGSLGYNGTREPEYVFTRKQIETGFTPVVMVEVHVDPITGKKTYEQLKTYKKSNGNKKLGLD